MVAKEDFSPEVGISEIGYAPSRKYILKFSVFKARYAPYKK